MGMDMKCKTFQAQLDAYIDSELDVKARRAMEEHAMRCDECAALLDDALRLATACAELNEGLTVPAAVRAGWREAVKGEIEGKNRPRRDRRRAARHSGVVRTIAAAAATLILGVGIGSQIDWTNVRVSSNNYSSRDEGYYAATAYEESMPAPMPAASMAMGGRTMALESDGAIDTSGSANTAAQTGENTRNVVVIRSARRTIETKNYDEDALLIDDLVNEYGAYYESKSVSGRESRVMDAVIRVPSESLDRFLTAMDVVGTIVSREDLAEDVTDEYFDTQTRLSVLRAKLEQLNEMTASATSVSDLIEINERANEVTADIEYYEGRIKSMESRRNYSSVTLRMNEIVEKGDTDTPVKPLSERMREAFDASVKWLKDFGQNAAVFGASLLPRLAVWVPLIVIVIILLKVVFGRKKKGRK